MVWYPGPSKPRPVKGGGIRVRASRGPIGETWWSRRWVAALETLAVDSRLERGRRYARKGQVARLEVTDAGARAKVQGSRSRPYDVTIRLRALPEKDWKRVVKALSARARFAAALLSGEVPHDIDEAFRECGTSLFPQTETDLETDCSCPDWENPCKHIAAVHYILAERFDEDPFLLFHLRGCSRDRLLDALRRRRTSARSARTETPAKGASPTARDPERPFWGPAAPPAVPVELVAPPQDAALLTALGTPPVWNSSRADPNGLVEAYRRATAWGLRLAFGDDKEETLAVRRRVGLRKVAPDGRVRVGGGAWYVGREYAGLRLELVATSDGGFAARLPDGSLRGLERPVRLDQMPPEG